VQIQEQKAYFITKRMELLLKNSRTYNTSLFLRKYTPKGVGRVLLQNVHNHPQNQKISNFTKIYVCGPKICDRSLTAHMHFMNALPEEHTVKR
jgi:hypothetical protein